jgi:hypothetical protein
MAFSGKQPDNPNFVPTEKNDNAKTEKNNSPVRRAANGQQAGHRRQPKK